MTDVVLFGDSRYPSLRHEIPVALPDPIAYIEHDGKKTVVAGSLDVPRMTELGGRVGFDVVAMEDLGFADLLGGGLTLAEAMDELVVRACQQTKVTSVSTPRDFPVSVADLLRREGIEVVVDGAMFEGRRRSKTAAELESIQRGERAAEAAMAAVRNGLADASAPTVEEMRHLACRAFIDHGAVPHDFVIIAPGPQGADPHEQGFGPIERGVPIIVDVFPRDLAGGCWGDLTRTLCVGDPPDELVAWHSDVREAQQKAIDAVRPGVSGEELNAISVESLRERGHRTRRDTDDGSFPEDGFTHYLGHGLGLDLHESPTLDVGGETLVVGDVITIEPGLYRDGFGGCRIEDVVLVTESGGEVISNCPYDVVVE